MTAPMLAWVRQCWLTSGMRWILLVLLTACPADEAPTTCPEVPCPPPQVCTAEGDCVFLRGDAGPVDAGPPPDAGPLCGNGVVEGDEPCDDANERDDDGCLTGCIAPRCGDGIRRIKTEDCDEGAGNGSASCTADCRRVGVFDGASQEAAALSCRHLKRDHPQLPTSGYWLDLDGSGPAGAVRVLCEMGLDGGGWTQMAHLNSGDLMWNAWSSIHGEQGGEAWGLKLNDLVQDDPAGQDIEYVFALRGTFAGPVVYSPFYSGLRGEAFDPVPVFETFDPDGFTWRWPGEEVQVCRAALWHRTEAWNWAAARGEFGCDGWSGGAGFVIHGSEEAAETAQTIWGMERFGGGGRGAEFSSFELYAR